MTKSNIPSNEDLIQSYNRFSRQKYVASLF